jgi:predicted enzyme related to lactoylglutathione lyase
MDWSLEVVVVPVRDVDVAVTFYRDQVGFALDHDTRIDAEQRLVQLTPRGSGCSIVVGTLPNLQQMPPGSMHGLQLVVPNAREAHAELAERGVPVGEVQVIDPRDGGTLFAFADPDGNTWVVQEIKARAEQPLLGGAAPRGDGASG